MNGLSWFKEMAVAVTICDTEGVVLEMNDVSAQMFDRDGGRQLVGSNLLECHPEPSRTRLSEMLADGQTNIYTAEKDGVRRLIYQGPWYEEGTYRGLVELAIVLPDPLPHVDRNS